MCDVFLNLVMYGQNPSLNHLKKFSRYHSEKKTQTHKSRNKVTSSAPDPRISCLKDTFCFPTQGKQCIFSTAYAGNMTQTFLLMLQLWASLAFASNLLHIRYACALQIIHFLMIFTKDNGAAWGRICPLKSDCKWIIYFGFSSNVKISKAGGNSEGDGDVPWAILKPPTVSTDIAKSKQMKGSRQSF